MNDDFSIDSSSKELVVSKLPFHKISKNTNGIPNLLMKKINNHKFQTVDNSNSLNGMPPRIFSSKSNGKMKPKSVDILLGDKTRIYHSKTKGSARSISPSAMQKLKKNNSSMMSLSKTPTTFYTISKNCSTTRIAFGKCVPSDKTEYLFFNNNLLKKKENEGRVDERVKINEMPKKVLNIFKTGLSARQIENVEHKTQKMRERRKIKEVNAYPMISQKKMVKNILPKEFEYERLQSPEEVLRNAYHPLIRYQKKLIGRHVSAINQEVNIHYSNPFSLVQKDKFSEKYQMCQDLIDLEKDSKLAELISNLINKNFKLGTEIDNVINSKRKQEKLEHKQQILQRFKQVIIRAAIHFKRLNISLEEFYLQKEKVGIEPFQSGGQLLIRAIKDRDLENAFRLVYENYLLVYDFDHFRQTPLHWAAKRDVYQIISVLVSKGGNLSAQDSIGRTPLHVAAEFNNINSLQILLYELSNPLIVDNRGYLPVDLTSDDTIKFILTRAGALFNIRNSYGNKNFETSVKNGLEYLFSEELKTNFEEIKKYTF